MDLPRIGVTVGFTNSWESADETGRLKERVIQALAVFGQRFFQIAHLFPFLSHSQHSQALYFSYHLMHLLGFKPTPVELYLFEGPFKGLSTDSATTTAAGNTVERWVG